jgi:protein arginine N-methyltransferase 1
VNSKHAVKLSSTEVLGAPQTLGVIDLAADNPEFFSFKAEFQADRDGVIDGLGGWFDCELAVGVWMTNSPLAADAINREQAFFAIDTPLEVKAGDKLRATIMARPSDNLISWTLEAPSSGKRYSHSTWKGMLLAPEDILRTQPNRVPRLNGVGLARRIVMGYCDGKRTAREIEQAVLSEHPNLFPSRAEISRFVVSTLARDTE